MQNSTVNRIPSTQALQCFEASARLGSFTLAGDELYLTQGGVSRQVIGLEQRLGVALFERQRHGLVLTDAGRGYLADIEPALRSIERATTSVTALKGKGGIINLSIPASWGNHWLMPRLPQFMQAHPDISLNVLTRVGAADFSNRQIDAAVEFRSSPRSEIECELLMQLELMPFASPSWKRAHITNSKLPNIAPDQMLQHTTLPQAWAQWWATQERSDPTATGPRYDLMFMAMQAAAAGLGVALLPEFMTTPLVASRRLVRLSPQTIKPEGGYYLSRSSLMRNESSYLRLRDWLRGQLIPQ